MGNIDSAKKEILNILKHINFSIDSHNMFIASTGLEYHSNQIIFELIKETYIEESRKNTKSLYNYSYSNSSEFMYSDSGDKLKQNSRVMQFSNYYRNELAKEFSELIYEVPPELLNNIDMTDRRNRPSGYSLSDYDFETLKAMKELKLLKYLSSKRITAVKKISNFELDEAYQEYRYFFKAIHHKIKNDSEYIMYSILFFTTELKYSIECVYGLATKLSEYNNSKSKIKFSDNYSEDALIYAKPLISYDNEGRFEFIKENSLFTMKMDYIDKLRPDNFQEVYKNYIIDLQIAFYAKQGVLLCTNAKEIICNASDLEKREFIENHYNIWKILEKEIVWENKKEKYLRDLFKNLVKEIPTPKIK